MYYAPIVLIEAMDYEALADTIFEIHERLMRDSVVWNVSASASRDYTARQMGKIESVIDAIFGVHFGQPRDWDDLFIQISEFAVMFAKDHIFADGNKRTAFKASIGLLTQQGIVLNIPDTPNPADNQMYQWVQDVVTGDRSITELADFLRNHVIAQ